MLYEVITNSGLKPNQRNCMKRALLSVSDKSNIVEFAKSLIGNGYEIISTGGTYKMLKDAGVSAIEIDEVTKFPECFEGRVKTLNPYILV